jgi:hypothetical protein
MCNTHTFVDTCTVFMYLEHEDLHLESGICIIYTGIISLVCLEHVDLHPVRRRAALGLKHVPASV